MPEVKGRVKVKVMLSFAHPLTFTFTFTTCADTAPNFRGTKPRAQLLYPSH